MAVETSPNPRSRRKSTAGKTAPGKSAAGKPPRTPQPQRTDGAQRTADPRTPRTALIDAERRRALIAESAYFRSERRGFEPGHETEDWVAAELEIDRALAIGISPSVNPAVQ